MAIDYGIGTEFKISRIVSLVLMAFMAIAVYNCLELFINIRTSFRRRYGLYFYSLLSTTFGIIPYTCGFFLKYFKTTPTWAIYVTLIAVGWPLMVTGQSLVLYSRLQLITQDVTKVSRYVLTMIVTNALICHVPCIVLLYKANSGGSEPFLVAYSVYEKVQLTIFFVQELIISGIYVWNTLKMLRSEGGIRGRNSRLVVRHLAWINIAVIALDVTMLAVEYSGYYHVQTTYKAFVYSVKLKMEFSILNQLLDLFQGRMDDSSDDPSSRAARTGTRRAPSRSRHRTTKSPDDVPPCPTNVLRNLAYARMDEERPNGVCLKNMEVIKTTEITVETSDRLESDNTMTSSDADVISLSGSVRRKRRNSASSSEIEIMSQSNSDSTRGLKSTPWQDMD